jgi:hypothetical protein
MTKKRAQYFPHDYNARNDPKLQELLMECGLDAIGLYWCIVEMLYEQGGKIPLKACKGIAFTLHADIEKMMRMINEFGLFQQDEECFWSNSINARLGKIEEITEQRRKAIQMRWGNKCNTNVSNFNTNVPNFDTNVPNFDTNVPNFDTNVPNFDTNKIKEKEIKEKNKVVGDNLNITARPTNQFFDLIVSLFNRDFSKKINPTDKADILAVQEIERICGSEENVRLLFDYVAKKDKQCYSYHVGMFKSMAYERLDKAHEWQAKEEQREYMMKEDAMRIAEREREAQMEAERERAEQERKRVVQVRALEIGAVLEKRVPGYGKMHYPTRRAIELNMAELLPTEKSEEKITQMYYSLIKTK